MCRQKVPKCLLHSRSSQGSGRTQTGKRGEERRHGETEAVMSLSSYKKELGLPTYVLKGCQENALMRYLFSKGHLAGRGRMIGDG